MSMYNVYIAEYVLNGLSILCSLVTIAIVLWVWKKYPASKESPSFGLTLWIAIADIPLRISDCLGIPLNYPYGFPQSPAFARFFIWLNFFGCFWFIYLTCMIVLDLQLVFFHRLQRQARIRRWYPLMGTMIAFLLSIPYLCFPNIRLNQNGFLSIGYSESSHMVTFTVWNNVWFHAGIIYSIVVVTAVCFRMLSARSELRQFNQTKLNNSMSRSLIRNAGLIIAYPAVLFLVYVPYLLTNWFTGFVGGTFTQVWVVLNGIIFSTQGILSFAIMLFHPVMLSTYSRNRSGLSSLWSEVTRRLHLSRAEAESGSSTQSYSKFSATDSTHTENPKGDAYVLSPSVKVMNSPPGFVNSSLRNNDTHINANEGKPNRFEIMVAVHSENSELDETTLGSYRSIDESTYL